MTAVAAPTDGVDERIGSVVHQLMWEKRITQRAMADVLGIQQSAMSRKLRGARPWLATEVAQVARVLGVTVGDLIPADDDAPAPLPPPPSDGAVDGAITRRYSRDVALPIIGFPSPRVAA